MIVRTTIEEGEVGLLYQRGEFARELAPGRHWLFAAGARIDRIDLRETVAIVPSQEILTSDNVQLRASVALRYRVVDAHRAVATVRDWQGELHLATQLALRSEVAIVKLEELLAGRSDVSDRLGEPVRKRGEELGVELLAADLRDLMLPGEVRQAFNEALKARAEGLAALERARGETAALRSLANAARLVKDNPALMNLRILDAVTADNQGSGGTRFVVHLPDTFAAPGTATSDED